MAGTVPAVEAAAAEAWRRVVPGSADASAVLEHGLRVARLVRQLSEPATARALAAGAVLHEIGLFVQDRGHFVMRGARWVAIHLDRIVAEPTPDERRLVGELILFHRHRGSLPGGLLRPALVDAFRRCEAQDRAGTGAVRRLERRERRRHPFLWRRIHRIRRPDR